MTQPNLSPAQQEVFRQVLTEWTQPLLRYLRRNRVPNPDDYDLVYDTATAFALKDPESITTTKSYLFGIARNKARHYHTRRRTTEMFDSGVQVGPMTAGPSTRLGNKLQFAQLIERLPETERYPFTLKCEGFTIDEIAASMDVSASTVKRSLKRARAQLLKFARPMLEQRMSGDEIERAVESAHLSS